MPNRLILVLALTSVVLVPTSSSAQGQGYVGVQIEAALDGSGIVVLAVLPDTGAAKAGLMLGDVIAHVNTKVVKDVPDFTQMITSMKPGDQVTLGILRNGKEEKVKVTLGERPPNLN
jgi:S1-C subfamily serine protease